MSSAARLTWLPRPPEDFRTRLKALNDEAEPGAALRQIATHDLDADQLSALARTLGRAGRDGKPLAPLEPFRLGLIGNGTLDLIEPALTATAARHGFALECVRADYGQVLQEALSPDSALNRARPDAVLIALDHRGLDLRAAIGDAGDADAAVTRALGQLRTIARGIAGNSGATPILQTVPSPPEGLFGGIDRAVRGTPFDLVNRLNAALADSHRDMGALLLDAARIAETVGLAAWHDPGLWNLAKIPFSPDCLPLYADHVARLIAALRGRSRKCLVLDLDNTLWGGIIGDDGMEGILIAQGDATGEAHLALQAYALELRGRGIVLAISSKNEDEIARRVFREHPDMMLREEHIAVFQANWRDKASNIEAIAAELSLGLDSFVFVDDNPVERGLVRSRLPQVAVPELPADPALYMRTLAMAGYFDTIAFSDEDRARAEFYQSNARRAELMSDAGNIDDYLASLDMEIGFRPFDAVGRARIAQLINKSNQFNLTTRRYTESEVAAAEQDPAAFTLQVRLVDRFGDNGMIAVVICREEAPASWTIDSWLMSCRVLGRRVEQMVLREILLHARLRGIARLIGEYRPTDRNMMVRDHYAKLGFAADGDLPDGGTRWTLDTATEVPAEPMTVVRAGFDPIPA